MKLKAKEIREKKKEELVTLENDLHRELGEARLKMTMGAWKNSARISEIRQTIARIQTIRKEKRFA